MVDHSRRNFIQVCGAAALLLGSSAARAESQGPITPFERVLLVDGNDRPLTCQALEVERDYVFFYPYASTPCFLLNLGRPTPQAVDLNTEEGRSYRWAGGVGPQRSVVAFSAICAHKLTHPSAAVSFIGYRREVVGYPADNSQTEQHAGVIRCCSEHSIYDPAQGARVISGPAPQPLAAIALSEEQDGLYATGVYGGELFERFFERFGFRLALEFGENHVREPVTGKVMTLPLEEYSRQRIQC